MVVSFSLGVVSRSVAGTYSVRVLSAIELVEITSWTW